ncbi:MAG: IclR family transcriptional regulator C-terminal domain-containing protein [Pseudomonadota bacterium]
MISTEHRDFVASLAKGMAVVRAFGKGAEYLTLSAVAERTGLDRAAARRFLLTLEALGYVGKEDKRFYLTPQVLELGFSYLSSTDWWDVAAPHMEHVARRLNQSCSAAVLHGDEIVYAARVPANRIMSVALNLGARLPAYCTSMGRVLLASLSPQEAHAVLEATDRTAHTKTTLTDLDALMSELETVRRQGFCFVDQELEEGLRSIAVPLVNGQGRTLASVNVSAHAGAASEAKMASEYLPALLDAAAQIRRRLP